MDVTWCNSATNKTPQLFFSLSTRAQLLSSPSIARELSRLVSAMRIKDALHFPRSTSLDCGTTRWVLMYFELKCSPQAHAAISWLWTDPGSCKTSIDSHFLARAPRTHLCIQTIYQWRLFRLFTFGAETNKCKYLKVLTNTQLRKVLNKCFLRMNRNLTDILQLLTEICVQSRHSWVLWNYRT
jgi:hypothetical protein